MHIYISNERKQTRNSRSTTKSQNKHQLTNLIRSDFLSFLAENKSCCVCTLNIFFLLCVYVKSARWRYEQRRSGREIIWMYERHRYVHELSWFSLDARFRFSLSIKTRRNESFTSQFRIFPTDASGLQFFYNYKLSHTQAGTRMNIFLFLLSSTSWLSGVSSGKRQQWDGERRYR